MKLEQNKKYLTVAAYALAVILIAISFYCTLTNWGSVQGALSNLFRPLLPFIYGFALAYVLNPMMVVIEGFLTARIKGYAKATRKRRRVVSLLLTYLFTLAILIAFGFIIMPQVVKSVYSLASQLTYYASRAEMVVSELLDSIPREIVPQDIIDQMTEMAGDAASSLISWLSSSVPALMSFAWQLGSGVISAFVAVIVSIYMLLAKEVFFAQLRKIMCAFLQKRTVHRLVSVTGTTNYMFGRFISGKIIDSIIIGILCFIGLSVMRMPNTVLVSFVVGVTNVIPYFGPFFGAIPSFFLIALESPVQGLIFLVFILILQQIDGNIIGPKILGDSTGLSAFWVLFSLLFFGGMFGIVGMFIGVPMFGVIYRLIKDSITQKLTRKGLSSDTGDYLKPLAEDGPEPEETQEKQ